MYFLSFLKMLTALTTGREGAEKEGTEVKWASH